MVGREVPLVSDAYIFENLLVQSQDVITPGPYYLTLTDLPLRLKVMVAKALS